MRNLLYLLNTCLLTAAVFFSPALHSNAISDLLNQSIPDLLVSTINKQIEGSLKAEKVTFSPPATIKFEALELKDPKGESVISIDKASIEISLLSLMVGRIKASKVNTSKAHLNFSVQDNVFNLNQLFEPRRARKKSSNLFKIELNSVVIEQGSLKLNVNDEKMLEIDEFSTEGQISIAAFDTKVKIDKLSVGSAHFAIEKSFWPFKIENAKSLIYRKGNLLAQNVNGKIKGIPANLEGQVTFSPFNLNLKVKVEKTTLMKVPIDSAQFQLKSIASKINLLNARLTLADKSSFKPSGTYDTLKKRFEIQTPIKHLTWGLLSKALNVPLNATASLSGTAKIHGSLEKAKVQVNGTIDNYKDANFILPKGDLELNLRLKPKDKIHIDAAEYGGKAFKLGLNGLIDLKSNSTDIKLNFTAKRPDLLFRKKLSRTKTKRMTVTAGLKGPLNALSLFGTSSIGRFEKDDFSLDDFTTEFLINNESLTLQTISANAPHGFVKGKLQYYFASPHNINGLLRIKDIPLNTLPLGFKGQKIPTGFVSGDIALSGDIENPAFRANANFNNIHVKPFFFNRIQANIFYKKNKLVASSMEASMPYGSLSAGQLELDILKSKINGFFNVHHLNLGQVPLLAEKKILGRAEGFVQITDSLSDPKVDGVLILNDVSWDNMPLGSGNTKFWFNHSKRRLFQLSGVVFQNESSLKYRLSFKDLNQNIHAEVLFDKLSIFPWTSLENSLTMPLQGEVSGKISVTGPLLSPDLEATLYVPDVQRQQNKLVNKSKFIIEKDWLSQGPLWVEGALIKGRLNAVICGLSKRFDSKTCNEKDRLKVKVAGNYHRLNHFDLDVDVLFKLNHLDAWVKSVKKEFSSVDTHFSSQFKIKKLPNQPKTTFAGNTNLQMLNIRLPGISKIQLEKPVHIKFKNNYINIEKSALFKLDRGNLFLKGLISSSKLDFEMKGYIPLVFSKYFVPFFAQTEGLAQGQLKLEGSENKPTLNGYLKPLPGSFVKPSSILDDITFRGGAVRFRGKPQNGILTVFFEHIETSIGDGFAALSGKISLDNHYQPNSKLFSTWDIKLTGSDVLLKSGQDWIETSFDLKMSSQNNEDHLTGAVRINDGHMYKRFSFQNFRFAPLSAGKLILPKWLWPLKLGVHLQVNSFHAQSQMAAFFLDSYVTADSKLIGNVESPRVVGGLEITEGYLKFPLLTFDIQNTSIPFKNTPGRFIDPVIKIIAFAALPQRRFNLSKDTNIQLTLSGSLEEMNLNLKTLSGDKSLDRSQLLSLLVSSNFGVENIEEALSEITDTRILIGSSLQQEGLSTQIQWQIGPRLEITGSARANTNNVSFQDLFIKLTIFDHLPFARKLFLESTLYSPNIESTENVLNEDLRLKLRLFEK